MANTLRTSLVVFTRKGNMPALLSHYRQASGIERHWGGSGLAGSAQSGPTNP